MSEQIEDIHDLLFYGDDNNVKGITCNFNQTVAQGQNFTNYMDTNCKMMTDIFIEPTGNGNFSTINFEEGRLELHYVRSNGSSETVITNCSFSKIIDKDTTEETITVNYPAIVGDETNIIASTLSHVLGIKKLKITHTNDAHVLIKYIQLVDNELSIAFGRANSGTENVDVEVTFVGKN